jgi:hypothetical protein
MKNTYFYVLTSFFLCCSCGIKEENDLIYRYALETNKVEKYRLNTQENDAIFQYEYRGLNDSLLEYDLNYIAGKEQLKLKTKTFLDVKENYNSGSFTFKIFQIKRSNTDIRTLVFNKNYGLLASLKFGENFIFSKDSIAPKIKELTFKKIFRSINNIRVY